MRFLFFNLIILFARGETMGSAFSTINRQPSTVNRQPSTVNRQHQTINRPAFYKAMEENNRDLVNAQLTELESVPAEIRNPFTGAMLMKKASFGGIPAGRLKLFRQGKKLLEEAIQKDPENGELRFLRLIVQEHAPGALGYKNDIEKDSEYIRKSYKSLPDELQRTIADYSKKSKFLKLQVS